MKNPEKNNINWKKKLEKTQKKKMEKNIIWGLFRHFFEKSRKNTTHLGLKKKKKKKKKKNIFAHPALKISTLLVLWRYVHNRKQEAEALPLLLAVQRRGDGGRNTPQFVRGDSQKHNTRPILHWNIQVQYSIFGFSCWDEMLACHVFACTGLQKQCPVNIEIFQIKFS